MIRHLRNYSSTAFISAAITFLALPFFTRHLTPEDFGILGLYFMFGAITTEFLSVSIGLATQRAYYKKNASFGSLNFTNFIFIITMFTLGGVIVWFASDKISYYLFDSKISAAIIMWSYVGGCLAKLFSYLHQLLIAQERSSAYSSTALFSSALHIAVSIILILTLSMTYDARIYSDITRSVVLIVLLLYLQRNYFKIRLSKDSLKWSLKFTWPRVPQLISGMVHQSFDKTMLTNYKGLSQLGNYEIALKMHQVCRMMIGAVSKAWYPYFYMKSELRTYSAKIDIINRYQEIVMIFNFYAFFVCLFTEDVIILMTTEAFYPSMYLVPILLAGLLFAQSTNAIATLQIAYSEKLQYLLPSSFISMAANIVFNIILIPRFGVIGVVWASLIATISSRIILFYFAQKLYPLPFHYNLLIGQFILYAVFIIPVYGFMFLNYPFYIKFSLRIGLLFAYIFIAIKSSLIKKDRLLLLWDFYKPTF